MVVVVLDVFVKQHRITLEILQRVDLHIVLVTVTRE